MKIKFVSLNFAQGSDQNAINQVSYCAKPHQKTPFPSCNLEQVESMCIALTRCF